MNWDASGAIGEQVGALAVLATLYYLTLQIKIQNKEQDKSNQHARAQLAIDVNNCYINNFDAVMCDKEFALIYPKGFAE